MWGKLKRTTNVNWIEVPVEEKETSTIKIEDCFDGEEEMEESESDKYLGDVISKDGRNMKNIKARVGKGTGIVSKIMTYLQGIPFGQHHFEVAVLLRNSLFSQ